MINFYTVIVSGFFGLLVALSTFWLTSQKELEALKRASKKDKKAKLENLYLDQITMLEKVIRHIETGQDFTPLFHDMAHLNARMKLYASDEVLIASEKVSHLIYGWSCEYIKGQPQKITGQNYSVISSTQKPHRDNADKLYPNVMKACMEMIHLMKAELKKMPE